jgi:hypothetical protein
MANNDKSDKILERVRALLAIAEHPNTPIEEADTALTQANRMMAKHAIDLATARAAQTKEERRAVERKTIALHEGRYIEFMSHLQSIFVGICMHNRVEVVITNAYGIEIFGMHDDMVWVEQQYTQIYFEFLRRLQPRWSEDISYDNNIYNFKTAGYPWKDINAEAVRNGHESRESTDKNGWPNGYFHKLLAAYKRHMKVIGDTTPVASQTHSQYRRDFAEGFKRRILARLEKMAADARGDMDESGAVVLYDMREEILEEVYEAHPEFHPEARSKAIREFRQAAAEREAADRQARETMLNKMTDKQRAAFLDKERRQEEREARADRNYWRKQAKQTDVAGRLAGDRAGASVSLDRNAGAARAAASHKELS